MKLKGYEIFIVVLCFILLDFIWGLCISTPRTLTTEPVAIYNTNEQFYTLKDVYQIIGIVENGNDYANKEYSNPDENNFSCIGPFQISMPYWEDADIGNSTYEDCLNLYYSEFVFDSYMQRYAYTQWNALNGGHGNLKDVEILCRIHCGGPKGYSNESTLEYWRKCLEVIAHYA